MTLAGLFDALGVVELAVVAGALAYVTHLVLDSLGISRTSKNLRVENQDLVRRNGELEQTVARLEKDVRRLRDEVEVLTASVGDLQKRDQAAVLVALAEHERAAGLRHEKTHAVLVEIRDAVRSNGNR